MVRYLTQTLIFMLCVFLICMMTSDIISVTVAGPGCPNYSGRIRPRLLEKGQTVPGPGEEYVPVGYVQTKNI